MKKIGVVLLSSILIASSVPAPGYAATDVATTKAVAITKDDSGNVVEPTDEKLENAIVAVKKVITVPKEYSNFNYYFSNTNSYSDSYWSFTWRNPDTNAGIMVNCDMDNHITGYNKYDYSDKNTGIVKFLKSELKSKADEFIKKIAPEVSDSLEFIGADYQGVYSNSYLYSYQRKNNGIEFPDNNVTVGVDATTGEVVSATVNWLYGVTVPDALAKVSKEDATASLKKNLKMKLVYRTNNFWYYGNSDTPKKAFLVYEPSEAYLSIDAQTGEVYKTRTEWVKNDAANMYAKEAASMDTTGTGEARTLTEEELKKVQELKELISKSEAIKSVTSNPYLYLDENLSSYTATLEKRDYDSDASYVWYITLTDPREIKEDDKDTYRAYAYATVDAKTGKILSYYADLKSNYDAAKQKWNTVKIKYDKAQSQAILEKFLKSQVKTQFSNSVLSEEDNDYIAYYKNSGKDPVYGGYRYQYNRVNEKVEYPYNNINGSVDGVTGKIYSYGYTWDSNVTFESTKGVISADKAMDYYLSKDGYGLKYEINTINNYTSDKKGDSIDKYYETTDALKVNYEIRLVYRADVTPAYISPFTGEQLNSNGEVYTEEKPFAYKDIENNEKNKNILLLADMNIGFEGENFQPDKNITFGELKQILSKVGYNSINDVINDSDLIIRERMAQIFINQLGLEKLSKLSGIYKTGYYDEYNIGSEYLGAVALAKSLGIMGGDANNNFNPKNSVTRFEAVNMIMNYIRVQQNGVFY